MKITSIAALDHFINLVRDLDVARRKYEKLGFTLTPRAMHKNGASQNHTAVFHGNYLELFYYPPDATGALRFTEYPAAFEGPVSVALTPNDIDTLHSELATLGLDPLPVGRGSRDIDSPLGRKPLSWRYQHIPASAAPLPTMFACQHLTPDLLYQAGVQTHANTAKQIKDILLLHPEPEALVAPYRRLLDVSAIAIEAHGITICMGRATFVVLSPETFTDNFPGVAVPVVTENGAFVGITLEVGSLAAAMTVLEDSQIPFTRSQRGGLVPSLNASCGLLIEFIPV